MSNKDTAFMVTVAAFLCGYACALISPAFGVAALLGTLLGVQLALRIVEGEKSGVE